MIKRHTGFGASHLFASLLATSLVAACGGSATSRDAADGGTNAADGGTNGADGASSAPGPTPRDHRPTPVACTASRPPGQPDANPPHAGTCSADSDCTAGKNGRCNFSLALATNGCTYDECAADSDCGASGVCGCRLDSNYGANACFHGNCKVDADCGARGYCSPSATDVSINCRTGLSPGSVGHFCHTSQDECTDDTDCAGSERACIYSVDARHWVCFQERCTG
jgi:hypothetical protein